MPNYGGELRHPGTMIEIAEGLHRQREHGMLATWGIHFRSTIMHLPTKTSRFVYKMQEPVMAETRELPGESNFKSLGSPYISRFLQHFQRDHLPRIGLRGRIGTFGLDGRDGYFGAVTIHAFVLMAPVPHRTVGGPVHVRDETFAVFARLGLETSTVMPRSVTRTRVLSCASSASA